MGNKPIEPEDIVSDGVEADGKPLPRDGGRADGGAATPSDASESARPENAAAGGAAPASGDSQKVPGPAEEQDEQAADDRGLTTDTSPD
jgi:hypothetical protein